MAHKLAQAMFDLKDDSDKPMWRACKFSIICGFHDKTRFYNNTESSCGLLLQVWQGGGDSLYGLSVRGCCDIHADMESLLACPICSERWDDERVD